MRAIPPPVWTLLLIAATYGLSLADPFIAWRMHTRVYSYVAFAAALILLAAAAIAFRRADTQFLPNSPTNNALVTTGVFGFTRNPMYLGMVLICAGAALWFGRPVMLLAPLAMFAVANWAFIPFEEAKMRRQFGEAFDAYTARVRRWV